MLPGFFVYIAVAINSIGAFGYIITTFQGKTKPNRITWLFWFLISLITAMAQLEKGVGVQVFLTFSSSLLPMTVLFASFFNKNAYWETKKQDYGLALLVIVTIVLWQLTNNPSLAIVLSITADGLAGFPTMKKCFTHPETENVFTYVLTFLSGVLTLLTIHNWKFAEYSFPLYITVTTSLMVLLIIFGSIKQQKLAK
jgi:hypothetical protein